ncbi:MAG: NAD-dependent epimerase/dehydratase family protein, partial [Pyrinomonadaceae bacterium]|nr:NAD-dependent epimerase/dehydratase family protein [Pyrinomonadaceae bacterium]
MEGALSVKIIVTGSTGLIGSALVRSLTAEGHEVTRLVRGEVPTAGKGDGTRVVQWDPAKIIVDAAKLEGHTAVVHLGGENVAKGRWTPEKKARIRDSRVEGTRLLAETLISLAQP